MVRDVLPATVTSSAQRDFSVNKTAVVCVSLLWRETSATCVDISTLALVRTGAGMLFVCVGVYLLVVCVSVYL